MKKLLVAVVASFAITCYGQPSYIGLISPSPIGVALTVGSWIVERGSGEKVYFVKVNGVGKTEKQAREDGFKVAIDNAVGSFILSETETSNNRIQRRDIIEYSSGYVSRYEVLSKQQSSDQIVLTMDVYVSHSKIANRLTNKSAKSNTINSVQLDAAVSTLQKQTRNGDKVIAAVLNDYPHKAFILENKPISIVRNNDRTLSMSIPYTMRWSPEYVEAIGEAVERTKEDVSYFDRSNGYRLIVKMAGSFFIDKRWESITFDRNRYQMFLDSFDRTKIMLRATITNKINMVVYDQCFDINNQFVEAVDNRVVIKGNEVVTNRGFMIDRIDENKISEMQTLLLEVVKQQNCRNII